MPDTLTDPSVVFAKLSGLTDQELATVTAAFGRNPSVSELTPEDVDRLDRMIDAVTAGLRKATEASERAGIPMSPETPAEVEAPELPDEVPVSTANLRQRIRDLDDDARNVFLGAWAASGLPQVLAVDGQDVFLDPEAHTALERLIAQHEPPCDPSVYEPLFARLAASPPGVRFSVLARVGAHGIPNMANRIGITVGRVWALAKTIEDVEAEVEANAGESAAANLGPAPEPGRVITEPVADAAELAEALPEKGTIDDLVAWAKAGTDVGSRARRLLDRELAKAKPRKGLVSKLEALVAGSGPGSPAAGPGPDSSGEEVAPAAGAATSSPVPSGEVSPVPPPAEAPSPVPFADPAIPNGGDADAVALARPLSDFVAPVGGDDAAATATAPASPPPPPAGATVPSQIPGQVTVDEAVAAADEVYVPPADGAHVLESALFRAVPVAEWGALMEAAYLRRLSTELGVAADILERHGVAAQAVFNAEQKSA